MTILRLLSDRWICSSAMYKSVFFPFFSVRLRSRFLGLVYWIPTDPLTGKARVKTKSPAAADVTSASGSTSNVAHVKFKDGGTTAAPSGTRDDEKAPTSDQGAGQANQTGTSATDTSGRNRSTSHFRTGELAIQTG